MWPLLVDHGGRRFGYRPGKGRINGIRGIPASHKIALRDILEGEEIIKYGETVAVSITIYQKG